MLDLATPDEVTRQLEAARERPLPEPSTPANRLAEWVRREYETYKRWRASSGLEARMLAALRQIKGEYPPAKLDEIRTMGGSEIFIRLIAAKCRTATALLRDIYSPSNPPWALVPTPIPTLPEDASNMASELLRHEIEAATRMGMPPPEAAIEQRAQQLVDLIREAQARKAHERAEEATKMLSDILAEGGFWMALSEFLADFTIYPFACITGPEVSPVADVKWAKPSQLPVADPSATQPTPIVETVPKMMWRRVSPFNLFWSPNASSIELANVVELQRVDRQALSQMLLVPGWRHEDVRAVLRDFDEGARRTFSAIDTIQAELENRDPVDRTTIELLCYAGTMSARDALDIELDSLLIESGEQPVVKDPDASVEIRAWVVGSRTLRVQANPLPRRRHSYYVASYERVPGSIAGNGLPDILDDIASVVNAAARALVNNLAMASGPQVAIDVSRVANNEDWQQLRPWKTWGFAPDPAFPSGSGTMPIQFFQPASNISELLVLIEKFYQLADEISTIPRYMSGSERMGGAGRTARGLAMLMGNASKTLQSAALEIDLSIMTPLLETLYDVVMLTQPYGPMTGDEAIVVRGVEVALERDSQRQRQLEFLQLTGNAVDLQIVGLEGRAAILRKLAEGLGLPADEIVPSPEVLRQRQVSAMMNQQAQAGKGKPGARSGRDDQDGMVGGNEQEEPSGLPGQSGQGPSVQRGTDHPKPLRSDMA